MVPPHWVFILCVAPLIASTVQGYDSSEKIIGVNESQNDTSHVQDNSSSESLPNQEQPTPRQSTNQSEVLILTPEEALIIFTNENSTESNVTHKNVMKDEENSSQQELSASMVVNTQLEQQAHPVSKQSRALDIPITPDITEAHSFIPLPFTENTKRNHKKTSSPRANSDAFKHQIPTSESVRKERGIYGGDYGDHFEGYGSYGGHKGYGDNGHYGTKGGYGYGAQHGQKHGYSKGYSKGYEHKFSHSYGQDHGQKYGEGHGYGQKQYGHKGYGQKHYGLHGLGYGGHGLGQRGYGFGLGILQQGLGSGLGMFSGGLNGLGGFGGGVIGYGPIGYLGGPIRFRGYGYRTYNPWYMY